MTPTRLAVLSTLAIACGAFAQTSSLTLAGRVDLGPQYIDDGGNTTRRLDSGTYTASGNVLTISSNTYSYCVSGTTMTMVPQGAGPTMTGSVVLQKQ